MPVSRATNREAAKDTQRAMPPPREVRGPWHVVQEKPKSRNRAKSPADNEVESSETAKVLEKARERQSTQRQVPTPKATAGHSMRRPLNHTEEDSDTDSMDRTLLMPPPSQQRPEVVRRLATPLEQTPVTRAGLPGRAFMDPGNRADTIWSPGGSATTAAIGLTKMMTLPKKSDSPRITTWSLSEVKLFADWCATHQVFQLDNVQA